MKSKVLRVMFWVLGDIDDPHPRAGEVRIRVAFSGVNPGDVKKREDAFGVGMAYPRVIPHSDGAGTVDAVGEDVSRDWIGRRVWCYGAQSYRPFGTAAQYTVLPLKQAVALPEGVSLEQGACLGIPGITAHRTVHVGGSVKGKTVLVQGGAGAVGTCAVQLAHQAGARVIATCRAEGDKEIASRAGADEVLLTGDGVSKRIRALAPEPTGTVMVPVPQPLETVTRRPLWRRVVRKTVTLAAGALVFIVVMAVVMILCLGYYERQAKSERNKVQKGMTVDEVLPLVHGACGIRTHAVLPDNVSDEEGVHYASLLEHEDGTFGWSSGPDYRSHQLTEDEAAGLMKQKMSDGYDWRWRYTFINDTPQHFSFTVTFGRDGRVKDVTDVWGCD